MSKAQSGLNHFIWFAGMSLSALMTEAANSSEMLTFSDHMAYNHRPQ
jgi:hypothetical protein